MSRKRLLILVTLVVAAGYVVVRRQRTPTPTVQEQPPPPAVEPRKPLQADAEGHYVPGYSFSVGRLRFTGFTLRPEAFVTFAEPNSRFPTEVACQTATISAAAIHLRCDDPQLGVITINGKFRTRLATDRLDTPVISAVVTVRSGSGEILYSAQDAFVWEPSH